MNNDICRGAILLLIEQLENARESQNNLDEIYEKFKYEVIREMNRNIPYTEFNSISKKFLRPRKPSWNDELNTLWKEMNTAEKDMRRSKC